MENNRFIPKTKGSVSALRPHCFYLLSSAKILHFSPLKQEKAVHPLLHLFCHLLFIFPYLFLSDRKGMNTTPVKWKSRPLICLDTDNLQGFNNVKHSERLSPFFCLFPFPTPSFCLLLFL